MGLCPRVEHRSGAVGWVPPSPYPTECTQLGIVCDAAALHGSPCPESRWQRERGACFIGPRMGLSCSLKTTRRQTSTEHRDHRDSRGWSGDTGSWGLRHPQMTQHSILQWHRGCPHPHAGTLTGASPGWSRGCGAGGSAGGRPCSCSTPPPAWAPRPARTWPARSGMPAGWGGMGELEVSGTQHRGHRVGDRRAEGPTHVLEVTEGDELDDVTQHGLTPGGAQDAVVTVQDLHVGEVGVAHPHNDDGHGQVGGADNGLPRVRHVCHHAVRQDQQDEVLLGTKGHQGHPGTTHPMQAGGLRMWGRTDASLVRSSSAATRATLVMIGATLVGPYSWILGRQLW